MQEEIENVLIEKIITRQEEVDEQILREIAKTLAEIGNLLPSQYYTIGQELKYGERLDNIIKILEENTKLTRKQILQMFEARAKIDYEFARQYYEAKNKEYVPYEKNIALKNKVEEVALATFDDFFEISTYKNISKTTGITFLDFNGNRITDGIKAAYRQLVDDAIMRVSMGKESFYTSLSKQLKTIGESGIQKIEYKSGYHRRIDSALRMNLQEGLTRLAMAQQDLMGKQFGSDGVEITVHENPAPDHAPLQGHMFEKKEFDKLQSNELANDVKGNEFQLKRVIGQWNCYHDIFSVVLGISKPRYTDKQLQEIIDKNEEGFEYEGKHYTNYEGTQAQRRIETEIRREREAQIMQKEALQKTTDEKYRAELEGELQKTNKRIDTLINKYHDFSNKSGLPTKLERTRVLTKK